MMHKHFHPWMLEVLVWSAFLKGVYYVVHDLHWLLSTLADN